MFILRIALAFVIPFILYLGFITFTAKKFVMLDEDLIFSAHSYGFPHDTSNYTKFVSDLYAGKTTVYYFLFIITFALLWFAPKIGSILFSISSVYLMFVVFHQLHDLSKCKRAMRGLDVHTRLLFTPLTSIYRACLIFSVLLFTVFNLSYDFIFVM